MQQIELEKIPNQTFNIVLAEQNCEITIKQKNGITFTDLKIDDEVIYEGMVCRNLLPLKPFPHLNFVGTLVFVDLYGAENPNYIEYNDRFILLYLTEEEYADL